MGQAAGDARDWRVTAPPGSSSGRTGTTELRTAPSSPLRIVDLEGADRDRAVPALQGSFEGIYRWHAKRTLHRATWVRAVLDGKDVAGASVLEQLSPEAGYVYYLFVGASHRRRGLGKLLLDDALHRFRDRGARLVWAAAEEDNLPSIRLFLSRGFRKVDRDEPPPREGGLGAQGFRSRMTVVHGEVLLGRWVQGAAPSGSPTGASRGGQER